MALWLQSVTIVDGQATFTGTSTRIISMVMALWLQSEIMDRQATIIDTSTDISSREVALCLQSVTVMNLQATSTGASTRISSSVPAVCCCRGPTSHFHRYFHQNK